MDAKARKYYEDIISDYRKYRHGRNLFQFCRDENIDYKWFLSLQRQYNYEKAHPESQSEEEISKEDFIEVSLKENVSENQTGKKETGESGWCIEKLVMTTPDGDKVELQSSSVGSIIRILTQLTGNHV